MVIIAVLGDSKLKLTERRAERAITLAASSESGGSVLVVPLGTNREIATAKMVMRDRLPEGVSLGEAESSDNTIGNAITLRNLLRNPETVQLGLGNQLILVTDHFHAHPLPWMNRLGMFTRVLGKDFEIVEDLIPGREIARRIYHAIIGVFNPLVMMRYETRDEASAGWYDLSGKMRRRMRELIDRIRNLSA